MISPLKISSCVILNDGNTMPIFGIGVWDSKPGKECYDAVSYALKKGYRHIDTAEMYGNEKDVGSAIADSGIAREKIFVTTKLWDSNLGYDHALKAFDVSLKKLNLEYIDLYLIHWPGGESQIKAWEALEKIKKQEKCKSIGVSNFAPHHLKEILIYGKEKPSVNQIEISPFLQQKKITSFCLGNNIHITGYCPLARAKRFDHPTISQIAKDTKKSPAQVMIRWSLQNGYTAIPKSSRSERIEENSQIFNFTLSKTQMKILNKLEEGLRFCPDPLTI
tara:strand:+ start:125 stop:955 length:831 start_codon:yes stop_codon:yes gene_type:complete